MPLVLLGIGIGIAFTPLTAAGIAGVAPARRRRRLGPAQRRPAARRLARPRHPGHGLRRRARAAHHCQRLLALEARELAHAVATALTGSAVFLALALLAVVIVRHRRSDPRLRV